MRSLKNLSRASLIAVMAFIGIAILANFAFLPQMRDFISQSTAIIEESRTTLNEMEISIKVLNNVAGVVLRDGEKALSENQRTAYASHQLLLEETTHAFNQHLKALGDNYAEINSWSLGRHAQLVAEVYAILESIQLNLESHHTEFTHMAMTNTSHEQMRDTFITLTKLNRTLNERVLKDITLVLNTMIFTLIAIIALFGIGIAGFVNTDLPYMMKSLSQIESNQYDVAQLPKVSPKFDEQKAIVNYIEEIMNERQFVKAMRDILSKHFVVDDVVTALFESIQDSLTVDRIGVAFVDYNRKKIIAEFGTARYEPILLGPGFEVGFEQTSLSKILTDQTSVINGNLEQELMLRPDSASLRLLQREGVQSNLILPLVSSGVVFGMVFLSSTEKYHFTEKDQRLAEKIIYEISGILNKSYFTKVVLSKFTASFSQIVERKDNDTGEHIERMVRYAVTIANGVRERNHPDYIITKRDILEIERNASSHDIGKVGIPDEILKKPGKLNPEEWEIMKTHVNIGADIFADIRKGLRIFDDEIFKTAEEIVRYHHERWDGSGYPSGLTGVEIPLSARIVALSDVFDALSSKRIYKKAFDFETSMNIIIEGRGAHFDPFVVDCFIEKRDEIRAIYDKL